MASFLSPWGVLTLAPRPVAATPSTPLKPMVIVKHRVVRHIVWTKAPVSSKPLVRYVYVSSGGGNVATSTSGSHPR